MLYWILSGGLVLLATGLWILITPESPLLAQVAVGYPYALLAGAVLLSLRFQRSRIACAALLAAGVHALLTFWPTTGHDTLFAAVAVLFPVSLGGLALGDDRGLLTPVGLGQVLIFVLAPIAIASAAPFSAFDVVELLALGANTDRALLPVTLPRAALLAFVGGAVVIGTSLARRRRPTEAGLLWALVAVLLMLLVPTGVPAHGAWLLAAGGVLALSVVESTYTMAYYDELTGLPARRALQRELLELRPPYALAVADIDHFKSVNDQWGHDVGDQVLRMVATRLARIPGGGRAYRSGGEEFTLVFPGLSRSEAREHAEQVRTAVEASPFLLRRRDRPARKPAQKRQEKQERKKPRDRRLDVTVSIGIAGGDSRSAEPDEVLKKADQALYRAKKRGRNQVAV